MTYVWSYYFSIFNEFTLLSVELSLAWLASVISLGFEGSLMHGLYLLFRLKGHL